MRISLLGSGSSGNATFVEENNFRFLIDAGFSCKKIEERLNTIGIEPSTIEALIITHEHADHVQGAGIFSRKYNVPIHITKESYEISKEKIGRIDFENLKIIDRDFLLAKEIKIIPVEVMHDAGMTVGFSVNYKNKKISIATDIGYITNNVREAFRDSDLMVIESNYDYNMLMTGPYPWDLKERVKGKNGHLSNVEAAKFIKSVYNSKLQKVYLAHVSKDNNSHNLAYSTSFEYLQENNISIGLEVAKQDIATLIYEI